MKTLFMVMVASASVVLAGDEPSPQEIYWHQQEELRRQQIQDDIYIQGRQWELDAYIQRMEATHPCPGYYYPRVPTVWEPCDY